jgi:hypothetical protein
MRFSKQFLGGILVGLAFGMPLGAAWAERSNAVNYTAMAGVGIILAIVGVAAARQGSPKS